MKLYLTANGTYAGTQQDAKIHGKGWTSEEVPTDKQGLIYYLNNLLIEQGMPRTGEQIVADEGNDEHVPVLPAPISPSYTHQSVDTDEQFAALPLARQLHLAGVALEAARDRL